MKLKVWGSRGSIPVSDYPDTVWKRTHSLLEDFQQSGMSPDDYLKSKDFTSITGFGGNTTCVQLTTNSGSSLIIDVEVD